MKFKQLCFLFYSLCFKLANINCANKNTESLLLVISLDGFRYDYLDKYADKNGFLFKIANEGVRVSWSESIFPTNTYPNHWSIVTGLYPENNGIINNNVFDPKTKNYFKMNVDSENTTGWFDQAEPIWITNIKSNKSIKHSVVIDWPGGAARYNLNDTVSKDYIHRHPLPELFSISTFNQTIDLFVNSLTEDKSNLGFIYFGEPDMSGHLYGPDSKEVETVIKELDYVLKYLFDQLKLKKRFILKNSSPDSDENYRPIELIILTDHGMTKINNRLNDPDRHVFLSDYFEVKKYIDEKKSSYGSHSEIWMLEDLNEEKEKEIYEHLKRVKHYSSNKIRDIYLKKDIPPRFYIKNHDRMAPFLLIANEGYQIMINRENKYSVQNYYGNHGFDNELKSMRGIFLAHGDSFKDEFYSKKPVKLIDVYSLLCQLLNVTSPHRHNGSFARIKHILGDEFLFRINVNFTEAEFRENLDDDDLMNMFLYGGFFLFIALILVSIIVPIVTIMSSVKATCHNPQSAENIQNKFKSS